MDDPEIERAFRREFRELGLPFLKRAFVAGILVLAAFMIHRAGPPYEEAWTDVPQIGRAVAIGAMLLGLIVAARLPRFAVDRYIVVAGLPILIALVSLAYIVASVPSKGDPSPYRSVGSIAIACWLTYGVSRFPTIVSATLCLIPSAAYVLATMHLISDGWIATAIFVAAFNAIGWGVSGQLERSERKRFQQRLQLEHVIKELARKTAEAERLTSESNRLLSFVSHDLRQPVLSLGLYVERLKHQVGRYDAADTGNVLDNMSECLTAMTSDLDRLLSKKSSETATNGPGIEKVRISAVLGRLQKVFASVAITRNVKLQVFHAPGVALNSNQDALWVVLSNLVSNSVKYRRSDCGNVPFVVVGAVRLSNYVRLDVRDNGLGFREPRSEEIAAVDEPWKSYGLGFAIIDATVRSLPEHRIRYVSNPGKGTRFSIYVPRAK